MKKVSTFEESSKIIRETYLPDMKLIFNGVMYAAVRREERKDVIRQVTVWEIHGERIVFTYTDGLYVDAMGNGAIEDRTYYNPLVFQGLEHYAIAPLGQTKEDISEIKIVSRNPVKFQADALDYAYAWGMYVRCFRRFENSYELDFTEAPEEAVYNHRGRNHTVSCESYVNALLYAWKVHGDTVAQGQYDELVRAGKAYAETLREKDKQKAIGQRKILLEKAGKMGELGLEDIYLVHETKYPIQRDSNGNVVLRPSGDWMKNYKRGSLHFTLNHIVKGHMGRTGNDSQRCIIVKLVDVINANPESLDNLMAVDTWFTPAPDKELILPGAIVLEYDNADREELFKQLAKQMGMKAIFEGGDHGSSYDVNALIDMLADELGVLSIKHFETIWYEQDRVFGGEESSYNDHTIDMIRHMSQNAMRRMVSHDRFSSGRYKIKYR